ncbi:MAG: S8 family serine peptidase, partial [Anaerolineae bacterium]
MAPSTPSLPARRLGVIMVVVLLLALLAPLTPTNFASLAAAQDAPNDRLVLLSLLDGPPLPADLKILERYGDAFVLAQVSEQRLAALPPANIYDLLPERTMISLNGWVWDTQQGEPVVSDNLRSAPDDPYFLVQFYAPVKDEWVKSLEALGVAFLGYHPNNTYIVRMDPALVGKVQAAHAVQWVGHYHPAYRLAPQSDLVKALKADDGRMVVEVRGFPGDNVARLQAELTRAGAFVGSAASDPVPQLQVLTTAELLPRLAAILGVYRVDAYDPPSLFNDKGVQTSHTWDVWKQGRNGLLQDLMGKGQTAGLVDTGLDNGSASPTVEDFYDYTSGTTTSRVLSVAAANQCSGFTVCTLLLGGCVATDTDGHGTHTAGSIVGNGYNSLAQRGLTANATAADPSFDYAWGTGLAPEANIRAIRALTGNGGLCINVPADWNTLYNYAANPARNVSNSWGNTTSTYGSNSYTADNVMWTRQDYLIVVAAGNSGPTRQIAQPGNAKNIISVGAAQNHRPALGGYADTASALTYFSARGPVATSGDTRFKPDIVAPGAYVLSTRTNQAAAGSVVAWGNEPGDGDGDGRPDYAWSSGTSMSTPLVTGAATVARQYFQEIQGLGNATPPSAALIKAALLNGAVDMGYGYEAFTSPVGDFYGGRNMQGWGFFNVEQSLTPRAPRSFFFDDFTNITNSVLQSTLGANSTGDYVEYTMSVVDSSEPLKVTLTWTDSQTGSQGYAVNNLNLLVTAPGGAQYRGNNFTGAWSVTGGAYDAVNNTEAVYLQAPAAGVWTIRVTDAAHGNGTQPFALYLSGGLGTNPAWTRACSGTAGTCTAARGGTSGQTNGGVAVNYFPSLKPLNQAADNVAPGYATSGTFRLTNWGRSSDTIALSYAVTDMTGAAVPGVTVAFSPAGPFSLASEATTDVTATVNVGSGVSAGAYDVLVTAASTNAGNRRDAMVIPLNVVVAANISNQASAVSASGAQVTSDFWASGQTLWAAYLSGESHLNGEAQVRASCSVDGGQTWSDAGQVDAGDGASYFGPVIAGRADGSSVTVVWLKPNQGAYARTWTQTNGCSGAWGAVKTLATYPGGNYRIAYPDVIYDNDGTILATWRKNDNASGGVDGIFSSQSTDDGATWSAAASVPDASGADATHIMGQLALDTARNQVWMAYRNSANSGDVYLKRWDGNTNAWAAAGAGHVAVATTADVETRPAIGYVADTDALWVTWHRYASAANASARLYYVRSNAGSLPNPTWGTAYQYPAGVRTAEEHPAMVVGDGANSYIIYLAHNDSFRGNNVYALRVPAAGGAPNLTYQVSATVDDPPLFARGNAGSPKLMWATTTINAVTITGPTCLYSKNTPVNNTPNYAANLGVSQTLYNLEQNFDLYLCQVAESAPTAVALAEFSAAQQGDAVQVSWETVSELDNAGFNLYRSESAAGPQTLLTYLPASSPGGTAGAAYAYEDRAGLTPGQSYYYWLEDVAISGATTLHGPVSVDFVAPTAVTLDGVTASPAAGAAALPWLWVA